MSRNTRGMGGALARGLGMGEKFASKVEASEAQADAKAKASPQGKAVKNKQPELRRYQGGKRPHCGEHGLSQQKRRRIFRGTSRTNRGHRR